MRILRYSLLVLLAITPALAARTSAQQPDTVRRIPTAPTAAVTTATTTGDSLRPPLSPRRAFLYSFLVPGYSQSVLGRHKAATSFILVEAITLAMIRESGADVHEARRTVNDTVVVSYGDASGKTAVTVPPRFGDAEVHTRESRIEDWVALLVANHLFAGADAFVAANLWDIPARLGLRMLPHGAVVSASLKW